MAQYGDSGLDRTVIMSNAPIEPREFYERRIPTGLLDPYMLLKLHVAQFLDVLVSRRARA